MKASIKKLSLEVLKARKPTIIDLSTQLCRMPGTSNADITLDESDKNTETINLTIEGSDLNYSQISHLIEQSGGVIHSINQVSAAKSKK